MMIKLFRKVRNLMFAELEMANKQNGHYFHSPHEGYGVIVEEENEAWDESIDTHAKLDELLTAIRKNDRKDMVVAAKEIERCASLAACEYIQVAAMARKLRESVRREERVKSWMQKRLTTAEEHTRC